MARRILVTGLSSFWGGRLAQAFERDRSVEAVVGIDTAEPVVQLERTEFVRADESFSILSRLVAATRVDTVVHAALVVDSGRTASRVLHEHNVIGTHNLLAAVSGPDAAVRHLVVKSSTLVYGSDEHDPTWFGESTPRSRPPRTTMERSLVEAEELVRAFAEDAVGVRVALLRCANVLGASVTTSMSRALGLPLVPTVVGFDPQLQFVEEHDVVRAIRFAADEQLEGVFNVAGDGRLPWSEVLAIVGRLPLPVPPVLSELALAPLRRLGLLQVPPELLALLRYGRGVDNRRLKAAGFRYHCDSAGALERFAEAQRLRRVVGDPEPPAAYRRDVEAFFRGSPAVVRRGEEPGHP